MGKVRGPTLDAGQMHSVHGTPPPHATASLAKRQSSACCASKYTSPYGQLWVQAQVGSSLAAGPLVPCGIACHSMLAAHLPALLQLGAKATQLHSLQSWRILYLASHGCWQAPIGFKKGVATGQCGASWAGQRAQHAGRSLGCSKPR